MFLLGRSEADNDKIKFRIIKSSLLILLRPSKASAMDKIIFK